MSNIPSSAMPHAGGQSNTTDSSSGSSTSSQFSSGQGATTMGSTSGQFSSGQGSSTTSSQYQPSQNFSGSESSYESSESTQRTRRRDTVLEKARDNKTGIAIGVVGAAAAAAIPFLLSKRNKSKEQNREFPVRVDNRAEASDGFSSSDRGTKNNY